MRIDTLKYWVVAGSVYIVAVVNYRDRPPGYQGKSTLDESFEDLIASSREVCAAEISAVTDQFDTLAGICIGED